MPYRRTSPLSATAILSAVGLVAAATPSAAMTGIGCPDLPMYYRAVGTIENGPGSCGLTMEEAKAILARGPNGDQRPAAAPAPAPRKHHPHHRRVTRHN